MSSSDQMPWHEFDELEKDRVRRRNRLTDRMQHKALSLPYVDDEAMKVKNTTVNGLGAKAMIGVAMAAGLGPVLAIWALGGMPGLPKAAPVPVVTTSPAAPQAQQLDSEWDEVLHVPAVLDAAGNVIQPEKIIDRIRYRSRSGIVEQRMKDGTWKPAPTVKAP